MVSFVLTSPLIFSLQLFGSSVHPIKSQEAIFFDCLYSRAIFVGTTVKGLCVHDWHFTCGIGACYLVPNEKLAAII